MTEKSLPLVYRAYYLDAGDWVFKLTLNGVHVVNPVTVQVFLSAEDECRRAGHCK